MSLTHDHPVRPSFMPAITVMWCKEFITRRSYLSPSRLPPTSDADDKAISRKTGLHVSPTDTVDQPCRVPESRSTVQYTVNLVNIGECPTGVDQIIRNSPELAKYLARLTHRTLSSIGHNYARRSSRSRTMHAETNNLNLQNTTSSLHDSSRHASNPGPDPDRSQSRPHQSSHIIPYNTGPPSQDDPLKRLVSALP